MARPGTVFGPSLRGTGIRWEAPNLWGAGATGVALQSPHHPVVGETSDGRWVVACPDCRRDRRSAIPIGIEMPMQSLEMAELMRDNHSRVRLVSTTQKRTATA